MYSIQYYVIKFVSDIREDGVCFFPGAAVMSPDKTDHNDIAEFG